MASKQHFSEKLWGGCFSTETDQVFDAFNASIHIDKRMYAEDIQGSIAYARALGEANLLTQTEVETIRNGLEKIRSEWDENRFELVAEDEDIHTANERRLTQLIGDPARKLHTGRSRNDQNVVDSKLWLRKSIIQLKLALVEFVKVLVNRSEKEIDVLMPGYTHLQRAQPVRWSHWLLSHAWSLKADIERLLQIHERLQTMPLGSGALAGNPFNINRAKMANDLKFEDVTYNSMHAVADRDFVAEFLFWSSLTSTHLSRLAEDLIIYGSSEFGFITLSDRYSTGSSLMPQKRNPDSMELLRGKTGTILGRCMGFMATLKGIPSTYNKDLQEDKEAMFDTFDMLLPMIRIGSGTVESLKLNVANCFSALSYNMLATDIAYYLVRKQIPFRKAHSLAGKVVALAENEGVELQNLTLQQMQSVSSKFSEDVKEIWNFRNSVEQYDVIGGTSLSSIHKQISNLQSWLSTIENIQG